jgi:hypothetical protein
MTRITTSAPKQLLAAAVALPFICTAAGQARSASLNGLESGLTAYPLDGIYKGNTESFATNNGPCLPGQAVAVEVRKGRFTLAWTGRQQFDAEIRPDGTFYATTGASPIQADKHMTLLPTLQGRVAAADIAADYGTRWCHYRLEASQTQAEQHLSKRTGGASPQP